MDFRAAFDIGRAIEHGFEALKRAPIPLFVGAFLLALTEGGGGGASGNPLQVLDVFDTAGSGEDLDFSGFEDLVSGLESGLQDQDVQEILGAVIAVAGGLICCGLVLFLLLLLLRAWILPGYIRAHVQVIEEGVADFTTLFSGSDRFLPMLLWFLLSGVISFAVALVAVLPGAVVAIAGFASGATELGIIGGILAVLAAAGAGIYVSLGLRFGAYGVALENQGPMEALEHSWELARGNRLWLAVYLVVLWVFVVVLTLPGLCLCLIGVMLTGPLASAIADVGLTESYLLHTRGSGPTETWKLWHPPAA